MQMRLTKKIEKEVLKSYNGFWECYLKGDIETMSSFMADEFNVIGSTIGELFENKKEVIKYYKSTADQIAGKVEFRNKNITITKAGSLILITEFSDAYILFEKEWNFYSKTRLSSLLEKKDNCWLFIQQHGSIPDSKAQEGEQVAFDKISRENLELREAVKRRTFELENKNRQLEIESSLERVRAVAMGMKKSEDLLSICEVSFKEFQKLGFDGLRNAVIHIPNDEQKYFMDYDYSEFTGGQIGKVDYGMHPIVDEYLNEIRSAEDAFFEVVITDDMLEDWNEFRRKSGQMHDQRLENAKALYYYLFSIGIGDIGISTFKPINESQIVILKKFRNVFDLAYGRYNDITIAEDQTREAQIEAALERVRSRSMAMHSSDEFVDASDVMVNQLKELGIETLRIGIGIINAEDESVEIWSKSEIEGKTINKILGTVPKGTHPIFDDLVNAWKENRSFFSSERVGDEVKEYYEKLDACLSYTKRKVYNERESMTAFFFKQGSLNVISLKPLSEEDYKIMIRFAKVFGQVYQRFLDLQKAELQAREARIEAALERVRINAMTMHSPEDLALTIDTFFSELNNLGINPYRCGVGIINKETRIVDAHATTVTQNKEIKKVVGELHLAGHPVLDKIFETWVKQEEYHPVLYGNEISEYHRAMSSQFDVPDFADDEVQFGYYFHFKEGGVFAWTDKEFNDDELDIFRRYTSVMSLTYRRYIDLKEAEAQAREAQIEAALERIRSRSMAMRKSEELADLSFELVKQVHALGIETWFCAFNIYDDDPKGSLEWGSNLQGTYEKYRTPREGIFLQYYEAGQRGDKLLLNEINEDECPAHYEYLCTLPGVGEQLIQMKEAGIPFPTSQIDHVAFFKYGYIIFITFEAVPESHDIFKRFAKVFEQTYTRFLDLQKAEVQARLAEQQASLDRVRGEVASMRTTEDLFKITPLIWKELTNLNINFFRCGVFIIEEELKLVKVYLTTPAGKSIAAMHLPFESSELVSQTLKYWRKQKVYKENWNSEQFIAWTKSLVENNYIKDTSAYQGGEAPPDYLSLQFIPFKQGMLYIGSAEQLTEEEIETTLKLADSFGVAYARYEDFQKLEAANKRKTQELEEARELQLAMLPKNIPNLMDFELGVYMKTATEVGGDYYDFSLKHDGSINIAIGDATGHGMKAGTMVTMIKSLFTANSSTEKITEFFSSSNEAIKNSNLKRMMIAFAMVNIYGKSLKVINAGMPLVYYYRTSENEIYELGGNNLPLGGMHNVKYKADEIEMEEGDVVLMLSDGLPELLNHDEEMYGYEKVKEELKSVSEKSPNNIIEHLTASAEKWQNGRDADDDITFVVIKVK